MAQPDSKRRKILPEPGKRNVLITSALPYVNNVPHLGNVVGSVLSADVFSRYCKGRNIPTLFVCGTDEYGTATETQAIKENCTPQELCDKYNALHAQVYEWFNIGFDIFGRTPTQQQTDIAQDIFTKLNKNGYLEERTTTQPYCETHKKYLADRFVEGECPLCGYRDARGDQCDGCGKLLDPLDLKNPRCKLDGATPVPRQTQHVFLLLDKLQAQIETFTKVSSSEGKWSSNGTVITESWLREGLRPRGITRDYKWGTAVPLPGYDDKVLYVWFDACIGYVSITANYTPEWERWWRDPKNVQLYQFMGKDNVPFHSVIFPGSQIGTGDTWTKLHHLSTTEYLMYEGGKFSKSRGIGVFGTNAKDTGISSDVWRYYLLSHRPESSDSEFEWKAFIEANNNTLLKNLGNFVNRIIKFVNNPATYNSVVPEYKMSDLKSSSSPSEESRENTSQAATAGRINALLVRYNTELEAVRLRAGLVTVLAVSDEGNLLLQSHALDNKLFASNPTKCAAVVGTALNIVHLLASILEPYMPFTSAAILEQLNAPSLVIPSTWDGSEESLQIKSGHHIGKAAHLFSLIPATKEVEWRELYGGDEARKAKEEKAAKAAKKKAEKAAKAASKKEAKKGAGVATEGLESVEGIEKGMAKDLRVPPPEEPTAEVTSGLKQATLQSS